MSEREFPFEVAADAEALAELACERILAALSRAIDARSIASFALAGGSTPRAAYQRLAARANALDWSKVEFFWGDERVVAADHEASNVRMARESLLDPLGIEAERIHPPRTELGAVDCAMHYGIEVRHLEESSPPRFDVVLLGMGTDGHTASLFPGSEELEVPNSRLVVPTIAPFGPPERVSFTLSLLNAAREVLFVVSGEPKAEAFASVRDGDRSLPAARVRPIDGQLSWLVDEAVVQTR